VVWSSVSRSLSSGVSRSLSSGVSGVSGVSSSTVQTGRAKQFPVLDMFRVRCSLGYQKLREGAGKPAALAVG
jgi:hypothetical protein